MKNKIEAFFTKRNRSGRSGTITTPLCYIVDRKKEQNGDIEVLSEIDESINGLSIYNEPLLSIYYYVFNENALRHEVYAKEGALLNFSKGQRYRQCECILFPDEIKPDNWVLLVELKYAQNYAAASRKEDAYPQNMIEQIIQTAEYLRRHGLIPPEQRIHAVLSFPNVIADFNSTLFQGNIFEEDESKIDIRKEPTSNKMDITKIAMKYRVVIRARNSLTVKTVKRLKFTSEAEDCVNSQKNTR